MIYISNVNNKTTIPKRWLLMASTTKLKATIDSTVLSPRLQRYWAMIRPQSGVVMAMGIPGISKSASFRAIADVMGMQYIDLRTSTMDETDLGVFPVVSKQTMADGTVVDMVEGAVPAWAVRANERPTLIHFEELNRCSQNVRNAALGILLERVIGPKFKFNENVYMVASGNPVNEYDSDVEVFGTALRNRLIPINFGLRFEEWCTDYANENVHSMVISFLRENKEYFGNDIQQLEMFLGDNSDTTCQYPSPRSWTFLSDYINCFPEELQKEALCDVVTLTSYVGEKAATKFTLYVNDFFKISVKDILTGKRKPEDVTEAMTMGRLIQEFSDKFKLHECSKVEQDRWVEFMKVLPDEVLAGHITSIFKSSDMSELQKCKSLLTNFRDIIKQVYSHLN